MFIQRTTRFGNFTAIQVGKLFVVLFSNWRFGFHRPRAVKTKNGVCDLTVVNLGRVMLMWEQPSSMVNVPYPAMLTGVRGHR